MTRTIWMPPHRVDGSHLTRFEQDRIALKAAQAIDKRFENGLRSWPVPQDLPVHISVRNMNAGRA